MTLHMILDAQILYQFCLLISIGFGIFWHPFAYAFLLTYPIITSRILINVLKVVWVPRQQIIYTLFLFIILVYILTLVSYWHYHDDFGTMCQDLYTCLIVTLDQSFKNDGGVSGYLAEPYSNSDSTMDIRYGRVAFDNAFNFIVLILVVQILAGIIIDKFSELREDTEKRVENQYSECFICGQTRESLEKQFGSEGFNFHIKHQHNLWDYLYFVAFLQAKKVNKMTDFTEMERFVQEADGNYWFPCYFDYEEEREQMLLKTTDKPITVDDIEKLKADIVSSLKLEFAQMRQGYDEDEDDE